MFYSPVSIKFKTDASTEFASGIYICDKDTELVLSLCPGLVTLFSSNPQGELLAALRSGISDSDVTWDEISLLKSINLGPCAKFFSSFSGFTRTPHEMPALHVFRFVHRNKGRKAAEEQNCNSLSISTARSELMNAKVELISSPFGGVNSALFIGYKSPGVISYVAEDCTAMLIDARFLDNMEGGIVVQAGQSLGLVYGQLAKSGGEGKLVTAIPWTPILNALKQHSLLPEIAECVRNAPASAQLSSSIVVVNVKLRAGRQVWGSGVLVGKDIVVTNKHVTGSDFMRIEAWFEDGVKMVVQAVSEPIKGVDLVLLKLKEPAAQDPVSLATSAPEIGTAVTSHGYGLLFPGRTGPLQPLFSTGNIAAIYCGKIYEGQANSECSMLVSTASCWNGSSGGGIFNEANELVGIMASNARDEHCNEIMPDMAFVIPVNVVRLALDCVTGGVPLNSTESFQKLWKLESTHTNSKRLRPRL